MTDTHEASAPEETGQSHLSDDHWRNVAEHLALPGGISPSLLRQAFSHASFTRETGLGSVDSNQRLEFLGDAVLDLILVEHLYRHHPSVPEGELTKMKAVAVRAQALSRVARSLGLGDCLLLGHGEEETGGRQKSSLLADCFEALIGAVYLSTDLAATSDYVLTQLAGVLKGIDADGVVFDHKTDLQELVQELTKRTPSYHTRDTLGPPHERTFVVEVCFGELCIGTGEGPSKQAAQQAAAHNALKTRASWLSRLTAS